jgi:hypothetical protein
MASATEAAQAKPQLASGLAQGVETLSSNEQVTFTLYVKLVLPLDGYVFWVNAALLTDSALYNASQYNKLLYNNYPEGVPPRTITAKGSFHVSQELHQLADRTTVYNHVIFTSLQPIQDFNLVNPQFLYIANYDGYKYAFSRKENYYKQADLYHYRGDTLYSIMKTQVIDTMTGFDTESVIVSNSLPIWLGLNQFFPMYPSYLVEQNVPPVYASVDIDPKQTTALQDFPLLDPESNPYQLVKDTVKIDLFGVRNHDALNFVNYILDYSRNTGNIGLMNMPVMQDEKVTQPEMGIIAQKKTITFEVSYFQTTVNDVARKLIEHAFITLTSGTIPS